MGKNLNLIDMLGLPRELICPNCCKKVRQNFDDYDVDDGSNSGNGFWSLHAFCYECEYSWKLEGQVVFKQFEDY